MHALGEHARQSKPSEYPQSISASRGFGELHTPKSNPALLKQENRGYSASGQESHTLRSGSNTVKAKIFCPYNLLSYTRVEETAKCSYASE
jgi:hypothetical protein